MKNIQTELTLGNNCSYCVNENRVEIKIDQINNNRDFNNLSGSLAIELWASKNQNDGSDLTNSFCVANTTIGEIQGQHFLENCNYDLIFTTPETGTWYFTLVLKEFNGLDYDLVDYKNFEMPYSIVEETKTVEIKEETETVIETQNVETKEEQVQSTTQNKTFLSKLFKKIFG